MRCMEENGKVVTRSWTWGLHFLSVMEKMNLKNKEKSSNLNNLGKEKGKGLVEARYFS